jgi:hypothetical protein
MLVAPIIPLAIIMCGSAVIISVIATVSRAVTERQRTPTNLPKDEVLRRLERIEQVVEVTAIEVERLAEANRFLTKLLAEKSGVS